MHGFALRVMTYNVHGCVGMDRRRSESRVAEVIAALGPDVVGLQELDLGRRRSAGVDQARVIAEQLGWQHHFHPAMQQADEHYGDAILSRFPIVLRQTGTLPGPLLFPCRENRGALRVEITTPAGSVHVINTHLGLRQRELLAQVRCLNSSAWMDQVSDDDPLILLGDFNCRPGSKPYRIVTETMRDTWSFGAEYGPRNTFPTFWPLLAVDHIFVNGRLRAKRTFVARTPLTRIASDHFPLIADLTFD